MILWLKPGSGLMANATKYLLLLIPHILTFLTQEVLFFFCLLTHVLIVTAPDKEPSPPAGLRGRRGRRERRDQSPFLCWNRLGETGTKTNRATFQAQDCKSHQWQLNTLMYTQATSGIQGDFSPGSFGARSVTEMWTNKLNTQDQWALVNVVVIWLN